MQATSPIPSTASGLRKAAILVASLDQAAADRVLDQMGPPQAQQVRHAIMDLGPIDHEEQRRIIEEFFRVGPKAPERFPAGIELDGRLAEQFALPGRRSSQETTEEAATADEPSAFRFLREAEGDKLARALAAERPQTIALVLAHLPPERAGNVLVRLAPALQSEVVHRLVDLEETDPEILREVERGLLARLSEQVSMQRRRVAGLSAVKEIVESAEPQVGVKILHNLAAHDRLLADRLGRRPIEFDDLLALDHSDLPAVIDAADPELLMLALVGALPELVDRVLRQFAESEASQMRHRLEHFGPMRLSDVEEARRRIADLVQDLAVEGRIELPHRLERLPRAA